MYACSELSLSDKTQAGIGGGRAAAAVAGVKAGPGAGVGVRGVTARPVQVRSRESQVNTGDATKCNRLGRDRCHEISLGAV